MISSNICTNAPSRNILGSGLIGRGVFCILAVLAVSIQSIVAAPLVVNIGETKYASGAGGRFIGTANSLLGTDVVIIGDHNGDSFPDYAFSSPTLNTVVVVMKKNTTYEEMSVTSIVSSQYFRVIKGPDSSKFGTTVGGIGDINGDSYADIIVGAKDGAVSGRTGNAGYAFVIFGVDGPFTDLTVTETWAASSVGFMILGAATGSQLFWQARSARGVGDVNGDGVDDFALGAFKYVGVSSKTGPGVAWLIFGKKTAFTTIDLLPANFATHGIYYTGAANGNSLGFAVMPAGDFNNDGIADFFIGARDSTIGARTSAGSVYLMHGSKTALATMDMSTFVTGTMGVRFLGAASSDVLGQSMGTVGDINGDGIDDIALGAAGGNPGSRAFAGIVYVIFGTTVVYSADVDLLGFTASAAGFAIYGHTNGMQLSIVAPLGDVDGDGLGDMLVGGTASSSRAHIIFGQTAVRAAHVDTATADVMTFSFPTPGAQMSYALDGGVDLNDDGIPDILMAAMTATVTPVAGGSPISGAGAVWMLPGPFFLPTVGPTINPTANPSAKPSVIPTLIPSAVDPTTDPSVSPTLDPSAVPSEVPSFSPSVDPSVNPSVSPTLMPSVEPSKSPSVHPSAAPSLVPSVDPSAGPTVDPTAAPFIAPTAVPSVMPTVRPTVPAVKDYELAVNVEQDLYNVTKAAYDAQKAAINSTIQHTVADVLDGVVPERVTDIVVEEEEEEGGRAHYKNDAVAHSAATRYVRLKYKITAKDPALTVENLRARLMLAVSEGRMDARLRHYAAQFGATNVNNGTFSLPQVTNAAVQRDSSERLTGVMIALVVISVIMAMVILVVLAGMFHTKQDAQPARGYNSAV